MKVSCQACGAKYTIADDKVRGRKVKIRCKSCGAPIVVDAQSEAPPAAEAPKEPAGDAQPPAAAGAKNDAWSVNLSDTDQRSMTTDEIVAGWKSGLVTNDAFVWKEGMADWVAILESDELKNVLTAGADPTATPFGPTIVTAPSVPPASKGLPAARVSGGRAKGGVDLFDAVEGAGGDDDVATSAPAFPGMAGMTPYDDGKMTGARNENSVLFSLDALKGGLTAEPAKKPPPPANRSVATDPLVASPASVLTGGSSPLFSLSADQALLTAPAPPDPPPRSVEAADGRPARGPNKLVIYGGAAAAAIALVSAGVLFGRSGKEEAPKDGKDQPSAVSSAKAEKKEEPKEEKKEEEKKPEEAKADTSASAAPSASAPKHATTAPTGKKEPTPAGTATTAKTTTKTEEAPPAAGTAPFSVSAAQVALTQAATNSASCKKPDGPTGSGKVQVTFATSGRVTTANVAGPPFAGTPVGGCVAGVFRRAKVPPFAGNPVTVSKSFMIK